MKITKMRVNNIERPMGFNIDPVSFSWVVEEYGNAQKQQYARVIVKKGNEIVFDSGEDKNADSLDYRADLKLEPRTRYTFDIYVKADNGETAEGHSYFETGKMDEEWTADWIASEKQDEFHPVLKKNCDIDKKINRARLYITGVGLFETYLNGRKLGNEYLAPYINNYENHIQVMTYDVKDLNEGENILEISLAKGWYMGMFGLELQSNNYGDRMAAIGELHLQYEDGTSECIVTDDSWTYYGSLIEDSGSLRNST